VIYEATIQIMASVEEARDPYTVGHQLSWNPWLKHRPYRHALGIEVALEKIEKNKKILYKDAVADACLIIFREKSYQSP
jgi:hypothetical protein